MALLSWPASAQTSQISSGAIADGTYESIGGGTSMSGLTGTVLSIAVAADGSVFAGGDFVTAGGAIIKRVAKWNGESWSPVGFGVDGPVHALAIGPNGDLYAGGSFRFAAGIPANGVARWDGSEWHALGAGIDGTVNAIAVRQDGEVFVGGRFTTAGGSAANNIARWNGESWSPLGLGIDDPTYAAVFALTVDPSGSVIAGGEFSRAGGNEMWGLAKWDGGGWFPVGTQGFDHRVTSLAWGPDNSLYIGRTRRWGGDRGGDVYRMIGTTWQQVGPALGGSTGVLALAVDATGAVIAAGGFVDIAVPRGTRLNYVARFSGDTWTPLGSGMGTRSVHSVAVSPVGNDVYFGGSFVNAGSTSAANAARWSGDTWHALGTGGINDTVNSLAVGMGSQLFAVGSFSTAGTVVANGIGSWNGSSWQSLGTSPGGATHLAVASSGDLYVGGNQPFAMWDGTSWTPPLLRRRVDALAAGQGGSVYVGYTAPTSSWSSASFIQRWNGTAFSYTPELPPGIKSLVVMPDGTVYAGNLSTTWMYGDLAHWNGSAWQIENARVNGSIRALAVAPGGADLLVAGSFTSDGYLQLANIARWDGTRYYGLGSGLSGPVYAVAVGPDGFVYAGGDFTEAGGAPANRIARWDGSAWEPLGDGVDGAVYAIAFLDGDVILGGAFQTAGGVASPFITRYVPRTTETAEGPESRIELTVGPNPTSGNTVLRVGSTADAVLVEIIDSQGRRIRTMLAATSGGRANIPIDAGNWSPGLYHIRATAEGSTQSQRLLVIR